MPVSPLSHTHSQDVPASIWTVNHNLGTLYPAVDVYVILEGVRQKIIPASVSVVDNKTVKVKFSEPRQGTAAVR